MVKKPLLLVFIDGLKPTSINKMPFLSTFKNRSRIKTDFGYSITCHATMYSGRYPENHKMWFLWKYSPLTSPYKWLSNFKILFWFDTLITRIIIGKLTKMFVNYTSHSGLSIMKKSTLKNWPFFDMAEKKSWDEAGYLDNIPTLFDILRQEGITWKIVGFDNSRHGGSRLKHIKAHEPENNFDQLTYLFIGAVDGVTHQFSQESPEAEQVLLDVDKELERIFTIIQKQNGVPPYFICFSDHGQKRITSSFDIYEHFEQSSQNLNDFIHIIDTNFARFWFRDMEEERIVKQIMSNAPSGFFLSDQEYEKYHIKMPDNAYGDAIYYLESPYKFKKTVWGYGYKTISVHGYLPDDTEMDGVFITNETIRKEGYIDLVDILPSILELLHINSDYRFDGISVWKTQS
jgi:predicted AlkP superfamily pyrophosphatase or phosphodiesterase